jgi:hypothetical protein
MARHDTTRRDKIIFYGFHLLEVLLVHQRQLTKKIVSLALTEQNTLLVCACHCMSCVLTDGRCERTLVFVVSCRAVPYNVNRPLFGHFSLPTQVSAIPANQRLPAKMFNRVLVGNREGKATKLDQTEEGNKTKKIIRMLERCLLLLSV